VIISILGEIELFFIHIIQFCACRFLKGYKLQLLGNYNVACLSLVKLEEPVHVPDNLIK